MTAPDNLGLRPLDEAVSLRTVCTSGQSAADSREDHDGLVDRGVLDRPVCTCAMKGDKRASGLNAGQQCVAVTVRRCSDESFSDNR